MARFLRITLCTLLLCYKSFLIRDDVIIVSTEDWTPQWPRITESFLISILFLFEPSFDTVCVVGVIEMGMVALEYQHLLLDLLDILQAKTALY